MPLGKEANFAPPVHTVQHLRSAARVPHRCHANVQENLVTAEYNHVIYGSAALLCT